MYIGFREDQPDELLAVKEVAFASEAATAAIRAEYEALQRLQSCPFIVRVHDIASESRKNAATAAKVRIVMELFPQGTLRRLVAKSTMHRCLTDERIALMYTQQVLMGVAALHASGVVHRDIKPENMLVMHATPEEAWHQFQKTKGACVVVKLSDFGSCKYSEDGGACATTMNLVGTAPYLAPESVRGKFSMSSDIWAVGISALELLTPGANVWAHWTDCSTPFALLMRIGSVSPPNHVPRFPPVRGAAGGPMVCDHADGAPVVSQATVDLMTVMLAFDPSQRPSAQECLAHPAFAQLRQ